MNALGYTGIGGRLSSGYGKFEILIEELPIDIEEKFDLTKFESYTSLSICIPNEDEMNSVLENASYVLVKKSGFVASTDYASSYQRKKDVYLLKAGSCFSQVFSGDVLDVSYQGSHPVYRYAKPLLMGVK